MTTAYLGLVRTGLDPAVPGDTRWHPVASLPPTAFDHGAFALAGRERLRAKLSYTNIGFALAPAAFTISELRDLYVAALGHEVSATNLQRVLLRRGVLVATGEQRPPGRTGGRPAAVYRFGSERLEITDQFAVLRPPGLSSPIHEPPPAPDCLPSTPTSRGATGRSTAPRPSPRPGLGS